jgi:pyruvyl transferase EpsO
MVKVHADEGPPMRRLAGLVEELAELIPRDKPVVYLDYPVHLNIGDSLIEAGTECFFKRFAYEVVVTRSAYDFGTVARRRVPCNGTIVLHGGGNFGDLYELHQKFRENVIAAFPKHRIVMLPQTLHFGSEKALARAASVFARHDDLHLCLRDRMSLEMVRRHFQNPAYLVPDMAHILWEPLAETRDQPVGTETLHFARRDKERTPLPSLPEGVRGFDWHDILGYEDKALYYSLLELHRGQMVGGFSLHPLWRGLRNRLVRKSVLFLRKYEAIVTNRLHMALLGLLLDRNVTIADNSYGKLSHYHAAWLADCPRINLYC